MFVREMYDCKQRRTQMLSQSSNLAKKTGIISEDVLVMPGNSKTTPSGSIRINRKSRSFNSEERFGAVKANKRASFWVKTLRGRT